MDPTQDEIRVQLGRILASDGFSNADRLSRFLRYVVERALAGESTLLKEYVIGTEVFDRGEQYDPRLDSIVRVEAGRLRTKLEEYYNRQGSTDTVIIRIPRGSYAPEFGRRPAPAATVQSSLPSVERPSPASTERAVPHRAPAHASLRRQITYGVAAVLLLTVVAAWRSGPWTPAATTRPRIAVLPFTSYSTDESATLLAARVTEGVTSELARLGTMDVVSHTSALQFAGARRPLREIAQTLKADLVIEANLAVEHDRVTVQTRLVDAVLDRKIWVEDFTGGIADVRDLQRRIASAATTAATRRR